ELGKGTAPGKFESVLREKCRAQEQHFRTTLLRGLEKEGALDKKMRQTIEELLAALAPVGGGLRRHAQETENAAVGEAGQNGARRPRAVGDLSGTARAGIHAQLPFSLAL